MKQQLLCLLFLAGLCGAMFAQEKSKNLNIEGTKDLSDPIVSPNGKYALVASHEPSGLWLLDLDANDLKQISENYASTYGYTWDSSSDAFYYREVEEGKALADANIFTYSIEEGKSEPNRQDLSVEFLPSFTGLDENGENQVVVFVDSESFQIKAMDLLSRESWNITNDLKKQFYTPILSHDKNSVIVHDAGQIYVYPLRGKKAPIKIGEGIATQWSPDDTRIIGFMDETLDGHFVNNSDLYLYDPMGKDPIQITHTDDMFEMSPSFLNNNEIIFSDDKTGQLFTLNLQK